MTEYLIGSDWPVNTGSGLAGHGAEASHDPFPRRDGAGDYENGIIAADGAEDVRPGLTVERGGDGLSATGDGAQDEHLADTVHAQEELGEEGVEGGAALLYASVGNRVPCPFGGGNSGEPQFAEIPGKSRLGHVPPALEQELSEIFLAAHDS